MTPPRCTRTGPGPRRAPDVPPRPRRSAASITSSTSASSACSSASSNSPGVGEPVAQEPQRVAFLPVLHLLALAVQLRVVHRVGSEAVGPALEEVRPTPRTDGLHGAVGRLLHGEHVHAVDPPRRHLVAGRLQREVRLRLRSTQGRAHGVEVVLAAEEHGRCQSAARFRHSWNSPSATAPSPKKQTVTRSSPRILSASARPVASGQAAADDGVPTVEARRRRRRGASTRRDRGCSLRRGRTSRP